jgi:hypothetical protein
LNRQETASNAAQTHLSEERTTELITVTVCLLQKLRAILAVNEPAEVSYREIKVGNQVQWKVKNCASFYLPYEALESLEDDKNTKRRW